jgi:glycosyltransferase involved in cell wall biosynthesis
MLLCTQDAETEILVKAVRFGQGEGGNGTVKPPVRIAHVLGNLAYGGLQQMALNLIKGLPAPAFSHVVLYEALESGPLYPDFASLAPVRHCPYYLGKPVRFLMNCTRVLREETPDIVLAYLFGNHVLISWAAFFAGVRKTYARVANDPIRYEHSRWKALLWAQLGRPVSRGEIVISKSQRDILVNSLHLPPRRVTLIPNGCEVDEIASRAAIAQSRRSTGGPSRIVMVANIHPPKDHPTLLEAVALLTRQGRRLEVLLAGEGRRMGEYQETARRLGIGNVVKFLGSRPDVPELLGISDLMVHATNSEGFGIVLIEAMAAGVPVIASDLPPCREILDDGRCGVLVPPRNPVLLAGAIERLLDDEDLRYNLTQAAAERVRSEYDITLVVERYAQLFQSSWQS